MDSFHIRQRLDRILFLIEHQKEDDVRKNLAKMIDSIPDSMDCINKDILLVKKPKIQSIVGRYESLPRTKVILELERYRKGEDLFGQVCDLILRIDLDDEEEDE